MTQVISVMSRHQFRQDDPSPLGAPRQLAPSYDRVRWLTALVEEFGPTFVASFHFTPYGKWVYETWVVANPRDGESSLVGPRSTAPTHARRRLKCTCVDCGDDFLTSKADTKRCPPCQIERKKYLQREWWRKARGSYRHCDKCGEKFVTTSPKATKCDNCVDPAILKRRQSKRTNPPATANCADCGGAFVRQAGGKRLRCAECAETHRARMRREYGRESMRRYRERNAAERSA